MDYHSIHTEPIHETAHEATERKSHLELPIIDQIFLKYGYGLITFKTFFIVLLILSIEGIHLTYFASLFIPIKSYYVLSDTEMQIYSSIIFITVAIGSFSSGFLSDKIHRKHLLVGSILIIGLCHFLIGTNKNIIAFTLLRLIIGLGTGIITPISLNLLTEYLPIRLRAVMLVLVWIGFVFGQLFILFTMLIFMPEMEPSKYPITIMVSSIFSFIPAFLAMIFLTDSPRNLILLNETEQSFEILTKMKGEELTQYEKETIVKEVKKGINYDLKINIKDIFSHDLFSTSLLLTFIFFAVSVYNYGPFIITSLTMKELGIKEPNFDNTTIIINQIWIAALSSISSFVGGFLSEIPYLGRNLANIVSGFIAMCIMISLIIVQTDFEIFYGFFGAFAGMCFNIISTYASEIYPTKIRDLALGYLYGITRLGGALSQIIYIALHGVGIWVPYYTTIGILVIYMILVKLLPIDTYHRPLDTEIKQHHLSDEETEKLK